MTASRRTICVATGSRADYGHLVPVLHAIAADPALKLQVLVTGQHLDPRFGDTWQAIETDGFGIDAKVPLDLPDDTPRAMARAVGTGVGRTADALAVLNPEIVLVLGDRFEILAVATAALMLGIPIAHIHGGETTEGAVDDAIRHAITKMAALHFAAAEPYSKRLRQMGEDPAHVHMTGAPGLDNLKCLSLMSRTELAKDLGLALDGRFFVVTYHPVTLAGDFGHGAMAHLLDALSEFESADIVITGVNSDPGNGAISKAMESFASERPARRKLVTSLGQRRYLSAVKHADAVIGNSSSGLIEAPVLGTPTVNVGDRQKGRLRAASVIDCAEDTAAIGAAISQALDPEFRTQAAQAGPPYGRGGAAAKIVTVLKSVDPAQLSRKPFHDIIGN